MCYDSSVRAVVFTADAVRQFKRLPKGTRPFIKAAIQTHLIKEDPTATTRAKHRLRRLSKHADYELRAGDWRVFYRVEGARVTITLLGEKRGARLVVEGEELKL